MFIIQHRRRRLQKTDFKRRLGLVKSGKTRVVIRKSLSNIAIQFVNFDIIGDRTVVTVTSKEIKKHGWVHSLGNVPAAYLTGLLAGRKAKRLNVNEAILDIGLQNSTKGSRIYAALKGVIDSGIDIPHDEEMLPKEDRLTGKHIMGANKITENFEEVKKKILG
ncbi:MAG: 50S ribosomal protein L18 [Nanoarchaeota archaeon]|nr:50S ribosomal protein L18 [Nanoarchaeota archaeon]MBU4033138.1 50S ribosomal protein L18 [Candidatus Thermoplasmatota archaeon]